MRFDYGMQLSPSPIELSIGTLVKPTLRDIADITFDKFNYFELLAKMTPETFYTKLKGDEGKKYWNSLPEDDKDKITLWQIVIENKEMSDAFLEIFNFFFLERVVFEEGYFILLNPSSDNNNDIISEENIRGIISEHIFLQVLDSIQQICCIADKEENVEEIKFKNELARKLYEKMQKAAKREREIKKSDIDFTLPNIISAVSNSHPTINPINVWDLTVFQLLDSFNRLQVNSMFKIDSTRVSVWGDEKKTFNARLWYKNEYDRK